MTEGETVKSLLVIWINRFACHKKWCYEACPKCKKQVNNNNCDNCKLSVEPNLSFSMGVEVADPYGAIWITAYDELASKIFQDLGKTAAHHLQSLPSDKLS
jgi:predicted amidophosphoribosyltransferase